MSLAAKGAALQAKGVNPKFMDGPEIPECCLWLWMLFMEIQQGRQSGMGANPISWSDLQAFLSFNDLHLAPCEIRIIRAFDRAYLTQEKPHE